jgi:Fic family protein
VRGRYVRLRWEADPGLYAPAKHRRACTYDAFVPDPIDGFEPELSGAVAGVVSDAENEVASLNALAVRALRPVARLLLRTESIASSKVEGIQMDARRLARAEASQETGRRVGSEAAEILANIDAMELAVERASSTERPIETSDVIDVHRALMRALMEGAPNRAIAGRLRSRQNWIGGNDFNPCGAAFVPPPPEEVQPLMRDLIAFCREETLPPLVQAAVAHAQFETIHPFEDGNGRTGRALTQIVLRRRGLAPLFVPPISVVLAADKDRYIAGLTAFREGGVVDWIESFAVATRRAADLAGGYARRVAMLQDEWRGMLRAATSPRADAAAWVIIDILPAHPVLTVPVAVAATGRTKPAVTNGIDELVRAGVLTKLGESSRNRAWEAEGLLDLVVGLEAGELR